jgi:tetratricopeptide (TPR) repeat protein
MKKLFFLTSFLFIYSSLICQNTDNINFAVSTHPMKVNKIELFQNQTKIELSIENQIKDGNFCADKKIDLQDVISKNISHLIKAEGIPVCPSNYLFTYVGEVLTFNLYFPSLDSKIKYINIIENCDQYCFSIKGIILSDEMNKEINLGYDYYSKGKLDYALSAFKMALENNADYPFGFLYFNIIQIYVEKEDYSTAKIWFNKLKNSAFHDKNEVISRLKNQQFYNKIN